MSADHFFAFRNSRRLASFTLIELLTVIVIIAILAALTLAAGNAVMKTSARDRARSEVKAMETALEAYKSDNGAYPQIAEFGSTNSYAYPTLASSPQGLYQESSELLYQSLTGQTNFGDVPPTVASGTKIYMTFTKGELGNDSAGSGSGIYIMDPFGNSYGYYCTNGAPVANAPVNGTGFFDLWSTAGDTTGTNFPAWINNWSGS